MTEQPAQWYRRFADEARGRSELYVELALGVAADPELLALLAPLPPIKQQPNLLLGAVRLLCGTQPDYGRFRACALEHRERVLEIIMARRTQTNEPARCATLLPLLGRLPPPLALLEVGASAGLCLLPDRYAYAYGGHRVEPAVHVGVEPPLFACRAIVGTPLPERPPEVVWRAGLDLAPVDLQDPGDVAWLEALVWPGEGERLRLLRAALAVARADPPRRRPAAGSARRAAVRPRGARRPAAGAHELRAGIEPLDEDMRAVRNSVDDLEPLLRGLRSDLAPLGELAEKIPGIG
jgi:uncharacterized protein DUF2332